MTKNYSIKVFKQYFNFSAAHFLVKKNIRELLHGHNYRVNVEISTEGLPYDNEMVIDFLEIKPIIAEICNALDHKTLIPQNNPHLQISKSVQHSDNYEIVLTDKSFFSLPVKDILLLPLSNITVELLANYISNLLENAIKIKLNLSNSDYTFLVEVEETPGQSATYKTRGAL